MSAFDKRIQDLAALAFAKIGELTKSAKAEDAAKVLSIIERIVSAVQAGFARKITVAELAKVIEKESKALPSALADNKKAIISEIDKRFPA